MMEKRACAANKPAAASCIGRVHDVGSRAPLGMGTHCWPSQRNWPSAETWPTVALGLWLKAALG